MQAVALVRDLGRGAGAFGSEANAVADTPMIDVKTHHAKTPESTPRKTRDKLIHYRSEAAALR